MNSPNRNHFLCTGEEVETPIIDYCKPIDCKYVCLSNSELEDYNSSLQLYINYFYFLIDN